MLFDNVLIKMLNIYSDKLSIHTDSYEINPAMKYRRCSQNTKSSQNSCSILNSCNS